MKARTGSRKDAAKALLATLALLAVVAASGCDWNSDETGDGVYSYSTYSGVSYLFSAETDWTNNSVTLARVDADHGFPATRKADPIDDDLGGIDVAEINGRDLVFVVGRGTDSIYVLDPFAGNQVLAVLPVGPGVWTANPYDVEVVDATKAYVTRQGNDDVAIINPVTGAALGTIDLTGIATNADGLARPYDLLQVGRRVFVLLQNLDAGFNFMSATVENGIVAVIDPATDAIETTFMLASGNPQRMVYARDINRVVVASAGLFWGPAGTPITDRSGLELFVPSPPYTRRLVLAGDHPPIDANIYDVAYVENNQAYILATDATGFVNRDRALRVNLAGRSIDPDFRYPALATGNDNLSGLAVTPDLYLAIGDGDALGLAIIDLITGRPAGFVETGNPPVSLAVIEP